MLPNGKFNPGQMTLLNHYAFGAIADWMHRTIGGRICLSPGWQSVLVKPIPGGRITEAKTEHESLYGKIGCTWEVKEGSVVVKVSIPANVSALIELPDGTQHNIGSGTYSFTSVLQN